MTIAFQYDGKRVKVTRARESGIVAMQHSRLKSILKVTFMMALRVEPTIGRSRVGKVGTGNV